MYINLQNFGIMNINKLQFKDCYICRSVFSWFDRNCSNRIFLTVNYRIAQNANCSRRGKIFSH